MHVYLGVSPIEPSGDFLPSKHTYVLEANRHPPIVLAVLAIDFNSKNRAHYSLEPWPFLYGRTAIFSVSVCELVRPSPIASTRTQICVQEVLAARGGSDLGNISKTS